MDKQSKTRAKMEKVAKTVGAVAVIGIATVFFYFYHMAREK